jgi:transcription elongation factor Elf1
MPANLVHCRNCRVLLNDDLEEESVEIPAFVPLQEIESMIELRPRGYFIACPRCDQELRINGKYVGENVSCKLCGGTFLFDLTNPLIHTVAFYNDCPHCSQELRIGRKYAGMKVVCKHCSGRIQMVQ